ncbi:hypothetical protein [Leptolyngbya ohadii]|uniref:hypothetical protein n=1 Tax=Leptolyngbya ohadii TaxID=1962290 RepID=UPI00117BCB80|nr:hypothetical protein [Leptolyngbya ohadii]
MDNNSGNKLVTLNLDSLSFNQFSRNPSMDIVCVAPVRTIVRREEEITIVRRVRKVEDVDASPACPVNSTQMNGTRFDGTPAQSERVEANY